jgi:NAD(P)-dependent dehydrogenase (short-subunit alcohol dehydrogenase family)
MTTATTAPQTYLVTGGAGFLGINVVRHLLERGHKVVSLDIAPFTYPERARITEVVADIRDKAAVDRAMTGVDIVIHTAAALPLYKPEDIYSTDIDGLRNVLQSAFEHKVARMVHISSTAVYGIPDHHPLYENDRLTGVGPYGEAKVLVRRSARNIAPRAVRADHPPQVLCGAGAAGRLCALLRLGQGWQELPRAGQRQQPLPVARRGRPLRRHLPYLHAAGATR